MILLIVLLAYAFYYFAIKMRLIKQVFIVTILSFLTGCQKKQNIKYTLPIDPKSLFISFQVHYADTSAYFIYDTHSDGSAIFVQNDHHNFNIIKQKIVNKDVEMNTVEIDSVYIEDIFVDKFRATLAHDEGTFKEMGIKGLLGFNFIRNSNIIIDFQNNLFIAQTDDINPDDFDFSLDYHLGDYNLPYITAIFNNKDTVQLKVDTGYNGSVRLSSNSVNFSNKEITFEESNEHTIAGSGGIRIAHFNSDMEIQNRIFKNLKTGYVEGGKNHCLLGIEFFRMFNRFCFDIQNKKIYFKL